MSAGTNSQRANYDILEAPLSDANDEFNWMLSQPWSNGNVGLIGCSSTLEWQLAAALTGKQGAEDDHSGELRRGRWEGWRPYNKQGQLVSRRRGSEITDNNLHSLNEQSSSLGSQACSRETGIWGKSSTPALRTY